MGDRNSQARPWLWAYDPGVPAEIDLPDEPLHAALAVAADRFPTRAAIRFFGRVDHLPRARRGWPIASPMRCWRWACTRATGSRC